MSDQKILKDRALLIGLVRTLSYREGNFTLASGKKSKFYIDLKATTLHPEGAFLIGKLAVELLKSQKQVVAVEGVGGLTLGADPLATAISLAAREVGLFWPAFIVRKEPKGHGTSRYIEGIENLKPHSPLLVVEDVVTTGGSSLQAIKKLRDAGFSPSAVLAVVDREEGGGEAFQKAGVLFFSLMTLKEIQDTRE